MLVAKLDFLQYIVVRAVSSNAGAWLKSVWARQVMGEAPHPEADISQTQDVIQKGKGKVQPLEGRMPNASGRGQPFMFPHVPVSDLNLKANDVICVELDLQKGS